MASKRKTTGGSWGALCRLLLLAAFLVQANLVQTHAHAAQPVAAAAAQTDSGSSDDTADYCFLCWEAAVAGQYVAPPEIVIPSPLPPERWEAAYAATPFDLAKTAHGWLSRAPPQ